MELHEQSFAGPRSFARHMIMQGVPMRPFMSSGLQTAPEGHPGGRAMEGILFREGPWQITMLVLPPNCNVRRHRHLRLASAELLIGGGGTADFSNRRYLISPGQHRGELASNLLRLDRGEWHGGLAGPDGSIFLSFQLWFDGPPGFIADDWETADE